MISVNTGIAKAAASRQVRAMNQTSQPPVNIGMNAYVQSLPAVLLRAREAVMARLRPILRRHGVTEQQWRVLRTLADIQEIETIQLATAVFLRPPSLSRIVRDLEGRGLLGRRASDDDQRRWLLSITASGLALMEAVAPELIVINTDIASLFGQDNMSALLRLLNQLEAVLGSSVSQAGPLDV
jgi:homoprotocatechuate degradation regulator HpaR